MSNRIIHLEHGGELAPGSIYQNLAQHQRSENWRGRELLARFQKWTGIFNVHFKLDVLEIALCVDVLPVSVFGHYRIGHNGFGLKGEIAINERDQSHGLRGRSSGQFFTNVSTPGSMSTANPRSTITTILSFAARRRSWGC